MATNYVWRVTYYVNNSAGKRTSGPNVADIIVSPKTASVFSHETKGNITENQPPSTDAAASVITSNGLATGTLEIEKIVNAASPIVYS